MPEGPEVRRIAKGLSERVSGRKLLKVEVLSGRYTKKEVPGMAEAVVSLPAEVKGVGVHGKFMYWIVNNDYFLWNTLGMTGCWTARPKKHSRVKFCLEDGDVYFTDVRNFGTLKFVKGRRSLIDKLKTLGPDMLAEDVSNDVFRQRIEKKPDWEICKAIMNQAVVSGVGNYVKADALWLAGLSPTRKVKDMSIEEIDTLNDCIKKVLRTSYESGGATIRTYQNFDEKNGEYSSRFLVYSRDKDPEGNEVLRQKTSDGRMTHWAPDKQH